MKRSGTTRKNGSVDKLNPSAPSPTTPTPATSSSTSTAKRDGVTTRPSSQAEAKPTSDDIRRRAYEIYLSRQTTGRPGSPETDWAQAEHELATTR
jgi:hypothetical protein